MAGFSDLNIPQGPDKKSMQGLLETAAHLGYSAVALNHVIDFKEKKQEIIKPVSPSELFPSLPVVQGTSKRIKVLTRLTLVISDPSHCNLLRSTSPNIRLYDIIAVFPKTEKLFHIACTTLDVDLVCINVTEKLPFYFRRPPVNVAIDRGIYFELLYTPAIKDSTMRRYTISNAISLMQICKGKAFEPGGAYLQCAAVNYNPVLKMACTTVLGASLSLGGRHQLLQLRARDLNFHSKL
uniref:Ribonuclease P protein subunit p30 n=1 Tax=Amazona collaria TaxID=241587 RepID=A0A8B9F436_9PSIT